MTTKKYEVTISQSVYRCSTIFVDASDEKDAQARAWEAMDLETEEWHRVKILDSSFDVRELPVS